MRALLTAILSLTLPLSDCVGVGDGQDTPADSPATASAAGNSPDGVEFASTLQHFDDCVDLLEHIRTEAMARVGPYGLDGARPEPFFGFDDGFWPADLARAEVTAAVADGAPSPAAAPESASSQSADADFSGTNVQVIGVDEPDIIKTDGKRIVLVRGGTLVVVDVTGNRPAVTGRVLLGDRWDGELLLHGDRVLVISNHHGTIEPFGEPSIADSSLRRYDRDIVNIDEVLLDGTPRRGRSLRVEGRYVSSRSIDGTARVVIVSRPSELPFVYPRNPAGEPIAAAANRLVVAQTTLEDWLPSYEVVTSEGSITESGLLLDCDQVYVPSQFSGFGSLAILSFDLESSLTLGDGAATFAEGETIYASLDNLYVATNSWLPVTFFDPRATDDQDSLRDIDDRYRTSLHKFSLTTGGPAVYEASGSVKGHLLNQFSLHEHEGHLFVAVTNGSPWGWGNNESESLIFALTQQEDALEVVGSVGDMGRGERIYSVRYIGDRAYVVTFREVDPLYVVDLADPTKPEVLGELKIPGYSSYLHPVGDGLLVGIGRDADDDGRIRGFKASLFDVSDPAKPAEIDTWVLPGAESQVEWNHRAFLWWAAENLMVVPVWGWDENVPIGAAVFEVTKAKGLDYQGLISHSSDDTGFTTDCYFEFKGDTSWEPPMVIVCKPGQEGLPSGYDCSPMADPLGENWVDRGWVFNLNSPSIEVNPEDRVFACWPWGRVDTERIDRSLIIGDDIWTLSRSLLQSNDLDSLRRGNRVSLPG